MGLRPSDPSWFDQLGDDAVSDWLVVGTVVEVSVVGLAENLVVLVAVFIVIMAPLAILTIVSTNTLKVKYFHEDNCVLVASQTSMVMRVVDYRDHAFAVNHVTSSNIWKNTKQQSKTMRNSEIPALGCPSPDTRRTI